MIAMTPIGTRTCEISSPLGRRPASDHFADRVRQRCDLLDAMRHRLDPRRCQRQPLDESVAAIHCIARRGEILTVRGENRCGDRRSKSRERRQA